MKKRDFCPTLPDGPAHSSAVPGPIRLKFYGLVGDFKAMSGESFGQIGSGTVELQAENCQKLVKKRDFWLSFV